MIVERREKEKRKELIQSPFKIQSSRLAMASEGWEEEDWELCNDDGFVYKRKKRRQDLSTAPPPLPATDPEAEQRLLKERKKRSLLKLKNQYQREIDQWKRMTHTLQAMENRTQPQSEPAFSTPSSSSMDSSRQSDSAFRQLIDDLLLQAEGQEAILQDLSSLCDNAESLCNAEEERLKQPFIDLPVWETPGALMDFFCDESQD